MSEIDRIKQIVCSGEGLPIEMIALKNRSRELVFARQMIMYFARIHGCTWKESGEIFNKDHSTAIHAFYTIKNLKQTYKDLENKIDKYSGEIKAVHDDKKLSELYDLKTKIMSQIAENRVISSDLVDRYNELTKI